VRKVAITGQVYFEVVHNPVRPFQVTVGNQTIEDIGTHFNINAYNDEPVIKSTLIEGAIKITVNNQSKILYPDQQAVVSLANNGIKVNHVDPEEVIAWKNGYFRFNNESIQSIMLKLARWYDIKVSYQNNISSEGFYGTISRNKNISEVLNLLESTQSVHFQIEGRRVTVSK